MDVAAYATKPSQACYDQDFEAAIAFWRCFGTLHPAARPFATNLHLGFWLPQKVVWSKP